MSILFSDIFEAIRTVRATKGTSEKDILNYVQERVGGHLSVNNFTKPSPTEMFNYKYPLLEVIQAIEQLQENKGTTNVQVCNFVRKMGKKANDPMKVLKTVCTLNKLVDDGILIKRGKRYTLPKPLKKREEHENCKKDIKEVLNDANEEPKDMCEESGRRGDEHRCGRGDEISDDDQVCEEDDEDNEDDEDEDDDDDDDDNVSHNSNDYDESYEEKRGKNDDDFNEAEVSANPKRTSNIRDNRCSNNNENKSEYCKGCLKSKNVVGESKCKKVPEKKSVTGKRRKKVSGGTINSCKIPEGEEVVFNDEQDDNTQEQFSKMDEVMEVEPDVQEKSKEISSIFQAKRRKSHSKRSHASNSRYRSRSPIKVPSTGTFQQRLAKDQADEKGPPEKKTDIHQKTHTEFLERDTERPDDGVKGSRNNCHRSDSVTSITPKNSFVYVKREKSCSNNQGKEERKMEQKPDSGVDVMNQFGLKRRGDSSTTKLKIKSKLKGEGSDAKKRKKGMMAIKCENDDGYAVLCSVCEKKKAKK